MIFPIKERIFHLMAALPQVKGSPEAVRMSVVKAAEGCRTPRRSRDLAARPIPRQLLECGSPLPLFRQDTEQETGERKNDKANRDYRLGRCGLQSPRSQRPPVQKAQRLKLSARLRLHR